MVGRDDCGEAGPNSEYYVDFPTCYGSRIIDSFFRLPPSYGEQFSIELESQVWYERLLPQAKVSRSYPLLYLLRTLRPPSHNGSGYGTPNSNGPAPLFTKLSNTHNNTWTIIPTYFNQILPVSWATGGRDETGDNILSGHPSDVFLYRKAARPRRGATTSVYDQASLVATLLTFGFSLVPANFSTVWRHLCEFYDAFTNSTFLLKVLMYFLIVNDFWIEFSRGSLPYRPKFNI